jgi:hypothetical protein
MKLVFCKNEELEISVHKKSGDSKIEFSYIDMIKELIKTQKLDTPELDGEFSEAEKGSISSMIEHINAEVSNFYSEDDDSDDVL